MYLFVWHMFLATFPFHIKNQNHAAFSLPRFFSQPYLLFLYSFHVSSHNQAFSLFVFFIVLWLHLLFTLASTLLLLILIYLNLFPKYQRCFKLHVSRLHQRPFR
ncbi:hypothetical protein HanRHA438_Chr04g0176711 [Helianthus annuus]|nr:hypothetical protein HanRHA438_Chr04g0176711 [Helianthus annuus]